MRVLSFAAIGLLLVMAVTAFVGFRPQPVRVPARPAPATPLRATIAIAATEQALTFARAGKGATAQTIVVTRYQDGVVTGVDLVQLLLPGEDAIAAYNRLGYDAIAAFVASAKASVSREAATLAIPVDLRALHAAVATNYPEHADEAKVDSGPFMFAKIAQPTSSRAAIPASKGLLDYEVELCLVTLFALPANAGTKGGLILCNDVTDRAALLRGADISDLASGKGFTDGKSGVGFLPVGDLFVVPRDLKAFVEPLQLHLSVNGEERQRTRVTDWIWDLDRLLVETAKRSGVNWIWRDGSAQLPVSKDGILPDRTLVFGGDTGGNSLSESGPGDVRAWCLRLAGEVWPRQPNRRDRRADNHGRRRLGWVSAGGRCCHDPGGSNGHAREPGRIASGPEFRGCVLTDRQVILGVGKGSISLPAMTAL